MRINPQLFENGQLRLGSGYPTGVKWHPLYAEGYNLIAASYSTGEIKLFLVNETKEGEKVELTHERSYVADNNSVCLCLDWSPDGHYIAAGYEDGTIKMFDTYTNKMMSLFYEKCHTSYVGGLFFNLDGKFLYSVGYDNANDGNNIKLWDLTKRSEVKGFECQGYYHGPNSVRLSPDGRFIVTGSSDNAVKLRDAITGKEVIGFKGKGHLDYVYCVNFNPDSSFIVSGCRDYSIKLWDATTGNEVVSFKCKGHKGSVFSVDFSPDGATIVSTSLDYTTKLWETATGNELNLHNKMAPAHHYRTNTRLNYESARYSPDENFIVSCSGHGTLKLYDAHTGKELCNFDSIGHTDYVGSLCYCPDGRFIVSNSEGTLIFWDTTKGKEVSNIGVISYKQKFKSARYSPDGRFVASDAVNTINLWDAMTKKSVSCFQLNENESGSNSQFSPDGRFIVSNSLIVRDATTGNEVVNFECKSSRSVRFSPNGCFIAYTLDNTIKICDVVTGERLIDIIERKKTNESYAFSFNPDGKFIVSSSAKGTIRLWNTATGNEVVGFDGSGHVGTTIWDVSFSPDSRYIVTGSDDNIVKLRDATTGNRVAGFDGVGHLETVNAVYFSPNGRYIASGSWDQTILIWNLEQILGESWLKEHLNTPLILTGVWFPDESLQYMRETKQGNIVDNRPIARCGECGLFFPVDDNMLGKELRCPNETERGKCNRLVKLNEFTAGVGR